MGMKNDKNKLSKLRRDYFSHINFVGIASILYADRVADLEFSVSAVLTKIRLACGGSWPTAVWKQRIAERKRGGRRGRHSKVVRIRAGRTEPTEARSHTCCVRQTRTDSVWRLHSYASSHPRVPVPLPSPSNVPPPPPLHPGEVDLAAIFVEFSLLDCSFFIFIFSPPSSNSQTMVIFSPHSSHLLYCFVNVNIRKNKFRSDNAKKA